MDSARIMFSAFQHTARLSTVLQILVFLPLTLATLSKPAFLSLSLLLTIHSIVHSTMNLFLPGLQASLPFLQVPLHPFFLLLIFNLYTKPWNTLVAASSIWGETLRYSAPMFVGLEGLATLICAQSFGKRAKVLAEHSEGLQFSMLIGAAAAYVGSAWWIIAVYPSAATSPLSSTLLGASITALVFITVIGFVLRRTNVVESSALALYLGYNVWLCSDRHESDAHWLEFPAAYAPLLSNLLPHLQSLLNFITHTIPKPLLIALLYRLGVLHLASQILPSIGADAWENEDGVDCTWEGRPSSKLAMILLTYRQTILIAVYSHMLLLDHSSQVWWRWTNVLFTLSLWAVEIVLSTEDGELGEKWKIE